jgi:rare lipoprotein A
MPHRKLALLLTLAVSLGPASLLANHLAQASSELPTPVSVKVPATPVSPLQVASVIQHPEVDTPSNSLLNGVKVPKTPDLYNISAQEGHLRTVIQVLPQDGNFTSLFVNGTEVLRYHGTVDEKNSYQRVKAIADTLNRSLSDDLKNSGRIHTDAAHQDGIVIGDTPLATVDSETAQAAQETPAELASLYTNRLRQSLGQPAQPIRTIAPDAGSKQETASVKVIRKVQSGVASWYGGRFHGRRTASGSRFNQYGLTAAHRSLPFGSMVRVTNQRNHRSCIVKITDRGPYAHGRVIDLSKGAAQAIGMSGVARVSLELVATK